MIFTILSRLINSDSSITKSLLYVFIIGCIFYIPLHWYLFMNKDTQFPLNYAKKYFYYTMGCDLIIAFLSLFFFPLKKSNKNKENKESTQQTDLNKEDTQNKMRQRMTEAKKKQKKEHEEHKTSNSADNIGVCMPKDNMINVNEDENNNKVVSPEIINEKNIEKTSDVKSSEISDKQEKPVDDEEIKQSSDKKLSSEPADETDFPEYE